MKNDYEQIIKDNVFTIFIKFYNHYDISKWIYSIPIVYRIIRENSSILRHLSPSH